MQTKTKFKDKKQNSEHLLHQKILLSSEPSHLVCTPHECGAKHLED